MYYLITVSDLILIFPIKELIVCLAEIVYLLIIYFMSIKCGITMEPDIIVKILIYTFFGSCGFMVLICIKYASSSAGLVLVSPDETK